jgi:hypothetical protein
MANPVKCEGQRPTRRDGRAVGAKVSVHAGEVLYPCSAFAPGAIVRVTAIPEAGVNIVREFLDAELRANTPVVR